MRHLKFRSPTLLAVIVVWLAGSARAAEDVTTLLRLVPPTSNTLAVVRVGELLESPRAKREGWKGETLKFLAGADTVPAWIDVLVMGAHFHPGDAERWSASVLSCPAGVSVSSMAKSENRAVQQLGGVPAMHTLRDAYFLQLKPDVLGVMTPALRQEASRWARQAATATTPQLSEFLSRAATSKMPIVMAIDMQDMLDPQLIRHRLEATPSLKGKAEVIDKLAGLFKGLKGVAFFAQINDDTDARIDMIFSDDVPNEADRLQALLVEMLADERLMLEDFRGGKASVRGHVFTIDAKLSDAGLRRILSMILSPFPASATSSGAAASDESGRPLPPAAAPAQDAPQAERDEYYRKNRKYYIAVQQALHDLQNMKGFSTNYSDVAGWFERYAQKIDNLPRADVDQELIDYAADVVSKLQAMASTTRGTVVDVKAAQATLTYRTDVNAMPVYRGWGWGWGYAPHWSVTSNLEQVRSQQAQSVTNNAKQCEQIRRDLEDSTSAIRRRMEQKYGAEFTKWMF